MTASALRNQIVHLGLDPGLLDGRGRLDFSERDVVDVLRLLNEDLFRGGLSGNAFHADTKAKR